MNLSPIDLSPHIHCHEITSCFKLFRTSCYDDDDIRGQVARLVIEVVESNLTTRLTILR